jgi:hypothetical protein
MSMKGKIALAITLMALGLTLGCQCNSGNPGAPSGQTVTNAIPRDANAIQIVFTNAPPTNVVAALAGIGAQPDAGQLIWLVPRWDFTDRQQAAALEVALRAGATMRKPE